MITSEFAEPIAGLEQVTQILARYVNGPWQHEAAIQVLSALAGRLLPEGGEAFDQYRVGDKLCCVLAGGSEDFVHLRPEKRHTHVRHHRQFPDGSSYIGPWLPATPSEGSEA